MSIRTSIETFVCCDCCGVPMDDFSYNQGYHTFIHCDNNVDFCKSCWNYYTKLELETDANVIISNPAEADGDYYNEIIAPLIQESHKEFINELRKNG
jgi:hypothetical protein